MSGIVFSVLIGRYGFRIVSMIGGVVWFIGFASSSLAPNVIVLCFTYGIVAGLFYFLLFNVLLSVINIMLNFMLNVMVL